MANGVDDVNEKLNGLVNLLQIVGIDGVDPNALVEEQKRLAANKKDGSSAETGTTAQSTDSQVLELIKKLQQAKADSPEILQALKSPELLALASLAAQTKAPAPTPAPAPAPSLDDVMDDDDDNYPKIGPGYSDEISVVSEMSTPTVMTKQNVNEEEYYSEVTGAPPPMSIGGGNRPPKSVGGGGRGKSRNLLATVSATANRGALAKGGGAAAQRRANYQSTMAKLQDSEKEDKKKASKGKGKKGFEKKKKKKEHDDKSKSSKGSKGDGIDWGTSGDDSGWPSFDQFDTTFGEDPFGTSAGNTETVVDADGFFTSDVFANVDPFAQASGPFASSNSSTTSSSKSGKKKKLRKTKDDGQGTRNRSEKSKDKTKNRRRRASIGSSVGT